MTLDATVEEYEIMVAVDTGAGAGISTKCFPPTASITMKVTTLGIHATLSYLERVQEFHVIIRFQVMHGRTSASLDTRRKHPVFGINSG